MQFTIKLSPTVSLTLVNMIMVHMRTLQPPKCLYVEPKQKHTVGLKTAMYTNTSRNHFNKKQTELQRIITNVYSEAACLVSPQIMANTLMISYHASWASLSLSLSLSHTHSVDPVLERQEIFSLSAVRMRRSCLSGALVPERASGVVSCGLLGRLRRGAVSSLSPSTPLLSEYIIS